MKAIEVTKGFYGRPLSRFIYRLQMELQQQIDYRSNLPLHSVAYIFWWDLTQRLLKLSLYFFRKGI